MKQFKKLTLLSVAVSSAMVLSACSNGTSVGNTKQPDKSPSVTMPKNDVKMVVNQDVIVMEEKDTKNVSDLKIVGDNKLSITLPKDAETLKNVEKGKVLYLPPSEDLPFGYSGMVEQKNANGTVVMREATLEEVFDELDIDFNSSRDTENLQVGLISANPNVKMQMQPQGHQVGIWNDNYESYYQNCSFENTRFRLLNGVNDVINHFRTQNSKSGEKLEIQIPFPPTQHKDATLNVSMETGCQPIKNNRFATKDDKVGSKFIVNFSLPFKDKVTKNETTVSFKLNLEDLLINKKIKYKDRKWHEFTQTISGNATYEFSLNGKMKQKSLYELAGGDTHKVWDNLRLGTGNKDSKFYGEIYGLDSKDKIGLLPLGGFVVTPASITPKAGNVNLSTLPTNKVVSVIVWVYLRADGTLSLEGKLATGMERVQFQKGIKSTANSNGELVPKIVNEVDEPVFYNTLDGMAKVETKLGATVSGDLIIAGIRPATVQFNPVTYTQADTYKGNAKHIWYSKDPDKPTGISGSLCYSSERSLYTDVSLALKLGAKAKFWGWEMKSDMSYSDNYPYHWIKNSKQENCVMVGKLKATFSPTPVSNAPKVVNLDIDYSKSLNENKKNILIENWRIKVYNHNTKQHSYIDLPKNSNGKATFNLPYGYNYDVALVAMGDINPFGETKKIEVAKSDVTNFNLGTDPSKVKVTSVDVSPKQPTIGEKYRVTIKGDMLLSNFNLSGCSSPKLIDFSQYQAIYECTAPNAGQSLLLNISSADGKHQYHKVGVEIQAITPISANLLEFLSEPRYYLESDNSRYSKFLFTKGAYNNGMTSYVLNDVEYQKNGNKWIIDGENRDNLKVKGNDIFLEENNTFIGKAIVSKINDLSTQGFPKGSKSYNILLTNLQDEYDIFDNKGYIYQNIGSIDSLLNNYQTINQSSGNTLWLDDLVNGYEAVFTFDKSSNQTSGTVQIYQANYKNGNYQQTKLGTGTWQRVKVNGNDMIKVQPSKALYSKFDDLNQDGVARIYVKRSNERGVREGEFRAKGVQDNDLFYNKIAINHLMNKNKLPIVVD